MKRKIPTLLLICSCLLLQGCIVLLPVIEKNRIEDQRQHRTQRAKVCPFTGERVQTSQYDLAPASEAQAFVVALSPSNLSPSKKRRITTKVSKVNRLDILVKQLRSGSEVARTHAATDIGLMGASAKRAIPALSHSLRYDNSKWVRRSAVKSLAKISGNDVIAPLTFALRDNNRWVVHSAKNALAKVKREVGYSSKSVRLEPVVYRSN